jgi:hypothetical protein
MVQKKAKEAPFGAKYMFDVALLYLANGEVEQASRQFSRALEDEQTLSWLFEAVRNLDQFVVLFPNNEPAKKIGQRLRSALEARQAS